VPDEFRIELIQIYIGIEQNAVPAALLTTNTIDFVAYTLQAQLFTREAVAKRESLGSKQDTERYCWRLEIPSIHFDMPLVAYCAGRGGTTAQPPLVPLTRVAVADWMDVSAAILRKVLIDSGVRAHSGIPSTS
jgi:hypothetical protein